MGFDNIEIKHEVDCTHLVPDFIGLYNNDRVTLYAQWDATEKLQDASPYLEWGWQDAPWYGFVPCVNYRESELYRTL